MCYNVHMDERNRSSVVKREMMTFNWDQTGMPATLVSRLERRELSAIKSVLNDANNHVRSTIDAESMAPEESSPRREPKSILEGMDEWEEWDRRFKSLLG